jgi:pyrroline-5-carboxylate reductase
MRRSHVKATVFLGGGRITGALIAGLRLANYKGRVVVHDRNPRKLRALQRQHGVMIEPNLGRAVAQANFLIVAVRPDSVGEILDEVRRATPLLNRNPKKALPLVACSLAAGIPLQNLRAILGPPFRWVRAMPSPVARTGRGLTALTFERGFPRSARKLVRQFFAQVGSVLEIPESRFDAFTVTYSASHGYHALAALAQAAQKLGLDQKTAFTAAAHSLADGIISWREGRDSLAALLHEAATPGGIAATVMNTMDEAGHARIIERGLRAGVTQARKNAKD